MEKLNLQNFINQEDVRNTVSDNDSLVSEFIYHANILANGNISLMKETANYFAVKITDQDLLPYHRIFDSLYNYFSGNLSDAENTLRELSQMEWPSKEVQGYIELIRGSNLRSLGALDQSVICLKTSLTLLKTKGVLEVFRGFAYYHLGGINMLFEDFDKAEKNFILSYKSAEFTQQQTAMFRSCMGLADLYIKTNKNEEGNKYLSKASELTNNKATEAVVLNQEAIYLFKTNKHREALSTVNKCIKIRELIQLDDAVNTALLTKVEILIGLNQVEEAIEIGISVLPEIRKYKTRIKERDCLKVLSKAYKVAQDFETAFRYLEQFEQLNKNIIQKQYKEILTHKNDFITQQRNEIFKQHQEIKSSILYSKNLQTAILPSQQILEQNLPNYFVSYLPKDIVAGDFYWISSPEMRTATNVQESWTLFASADCTGHGVPGAIVSFICSDLLDRAVNEFNLIEPALILDKVTELIIKRLGMNDHLVTDGMDISLAAYNKETNELKWAGANNPLIIVSNDELSEIKGDRQGIGYYRNIKPFHSHSIYVKKNDVIYLGTDGYADQFGGERGKKMSQKVYKQKLLSVHSLPLKKQKKELENFLKQWSGNEDQLDDICILGVKF